MLGEFWASVEDSHLTLGQRLVFAGRAVGFLSEHFFELALPFTVDD